MHKAEDIGIDDFQANRAPDRAYRTSPLKGLWAHMKGGFFHDGRFATLMDVMNHYDGFFHLGLSDGEKRDVIEYLKSLSDDVSPTSVHGEAVTASVEDEGAGGEPIAARGGLSVWPLPAVSGQAVHIAFDLPSQVASAPPADLRVEVYDVGGRRVALVPAASAPAAHGLITVTWNGRIEGGNAASPGVYMMRAEAPSIGLHNLRRIVVR
jgi:hypothetical protein